MEKISRNDPLDARKIRIVSPYPITYRFKVNEEFHGKTLLETMSTRFPFHGRQVWEDKINNGLVGVNGEHTDPEQLLKRQDEVYHHNPKVVEPTVPDEVLVLETQPDYLIAYKPAPLPMHPGGRYNKNSMTEILKDQGYGDLRIVHRLDAVTSGLVLFARNKEFAKQAMLNFSRSEVRKTYYAKVAGTPKQRTMTIDAPIRRKTGFVFESKLGLTRAKEAITEFEVVEKSTDSSIIKCHPKTGRTHQIRLHLEQWGYPIIDDPIYGLNGDKSSQTAQKKAISLLNAGLEIESLGIKAELDIPDNWRE
ncbi:RluA family pseudouridine synthase [Gracilimonas amylolytica]|uniref:RluA family pseudouridine synthase n=1 Tax=Gracilimonas amylolytica TaxID=1749045 RepID=UPI001E59A983|nr:RluA family pseudouridine synthase [Gracilimonas amylolytica]